MVECPSCSPEMSRLRALNVTLATATVRDQAKALADLTDDVRPRSPVARVRVLALRPHAVVVALVARGAKRASKPLIRLLGNTPGRALNAPGVVPARSAPQDGAWTAGKLPPPTCCSTRSLGGRSSSSRGRWRTGWIKYNPLTPAEAGQGRPSPRDLASFSPTSTWATGGLRWTWSTSGLLEGDDEGTRARVLRAYVLSASWHDPMLRPGEAAKVLLRPERVDEDGRP